MNRQNIDKIKQLADIADQEGLYTASSHLDDSILNLLNNDDFNAVVSFCRAKKEIVASKNEKLIKIAATTDSFNDTDPSKNEHIITEFKELEKLYPMLENEIKEYHDKETSGIPIIFFDFYSKIGTFNTTIYNLIKNNFGNTRELMDMIQNNHIPNPKIINKALKKNKTGSIDTAIAGHRLMSLQKAYNIIKETLEKKTDTLYIPEEETQTSSPTVNLEERQLEQNIQTQPIQLPTKNEEEWNLKIPKPKPSWEHNHETPYFQGKPKLGEDFIAAIQKNRSELDNKYPGKIDEIINKVKVLTTANNKNRVVLAEKEDFWDGVLRLRKDSVSSFLKSFFNNEDETVQKFIEDVQKTIVEQTNNDAGIVNETKDDRMDEEQKDVINSQQNQIDDIGYPPPNIRFSTLDKGSTPESPSKGRLQVQKLLTEYFPSIGIKNPISRIEHVMNDPKEIELTLIAAQRWLKEKTSPSKTKQTDETIDENPQNKTSFIDKKNKFNRWLEFFETAKKQNNVERMNTAINKIDTMLSIIRNEHPELVDDINQMDAKFQQMKSQLPSITALTMNRLKTTFNLKRNRLS